MKKILNKTDIFGAVLCLCSMIPGAILYSRIPDKIPTHFNISGQPDRYSSKAFAVFGLPLILTALELLICIITKQDERTEKAGKLGTIYRFIPGTVGFIVECLMLLYALEKLNNVIAVTGCCMAVIFIVIGNYLPKVRQNSFIGIKTKRTLSSEIVWHKTHRLAGFALTICGIALIPMSFLGLGFCLAVIILLAVAVPLLYAHFVKE